MKTVAIIGASTNRSKFGNKALRAHRDKGFRVLPVHPTAKSVEGLEAFRTVGDISVPLDRISVYLPPSLTLSVLKEIADAKASEVWFNPGSDDENVRNEAERLGIQAIYGCSIIDLDASPGDYD